MGFDIQHYYSLHQNLTLEDLAKASSKHTLKGLVKVINKVRQRRGNHYGSLLTSSKNMALVMILLAWEHFLNQCKLF